MGVKGKLNGFRPRSNISDIILRTTTPTPRDESTILCNDAITVQAYSRERQTNTTSFAIIILGVSIGISISPPAAIGIDTGGWPRFLEVVEA